MNYAIGNEILVGSLSYPLYRFTNENIVLKSLSGVFSVDTVGNELSVDTFALTVRYDPTVESLYAPVEADAYETEPGPLYALATAAGRAYMSELPYGTPVYWSCGGEFFTKGYLQSVDRISKFAWRLTAVSGVGLLADSYHAGGLYAGEAAGDIITDIIGGVFPFSVDEAVASVTVNGWLSYDTRRNNLHRILFALGAALLRGDENTDYTIGFIRELDDPPAIPDSRIALGGRVAYNLPATAAEITEHSFFAAATDPTETLFDNSGGGDAGRQTVVFGGPYHDLSVTGTLTVLESGVNYAIVSGQGILTGKAYTHTTKIITETSGATGPALIKRVTDNTLISALNSQSVAKRVLSYYSTAKTVSARLIQQSERCGNMFSFNDAFGDATKGFLQKMTLTPTSIKAAQCEFVDGYTPTGQGNFYTNRVFVDTDGSFTVPAGVSRIRLVLVGGGSGGDGGLNGENGKGGNADMTRADNRPTSLAILYENQGEALGGLAGEAGAAGKIYIADLDVTAGDVLSFSIGAAGSGGAANGGAGSAGSATSVSGDVSASSSDGDVLALGYLDPFTQEVFGFAGEAGHDGGNGGQTDTVSLDADGGGAGLSGGTVGEYSGGAGGSGIQNADIIDYDSTYLPPWTAGFFFFNASGGGGGGAAYGNAGADGEAGWWNMHTGEPGFDGWAMHNPQGGAGGDGADAVAPAAAFYGCGGGGGNGGGAGGNGAGCAIWATYGDMGMTWFSYMIAPSGGAGGAGSAGGDGGAGCAIIYY